MDRRDTAREYCQERLAPRVLDAYRNESASFLLLCFAALPRMEPSLTPPRPLPADFDPKIMSEMVGKNGDQGITAILT